MYKTLILAGLGEVTQSNSKGANQVSAGRGLQLHHVLWFGSEDPFLMLHTHT